MCISDLKKKIKKIIINYKLLVFRFNTVKYKNSKLNKVNNIDSVVFSKNRAIQLHAFLISYIECIENRNSIFILYKATTVEHENSYLELIQLFDSSKFIFIKEVSFRKQLLEILKLSNI
jgi:hypothetical protein